jgi:RNA ligase
MKPLLRKNYGSIGHLPNSRLGEGDHSLSVGQASILTDKPRDYKDLIIVQEKLDGANVGVLRHEGRLIGLTRKGHRCMDSPMEQFQLFQKYICRNESSFDFLEEGERVVGEWIAMAHGTRYKTDTPFIAFDLMKDDVRELYLNFLLRVGPNLPIAKVLHIGQPITTKRIEKLIDQRGYGDTYGFHGALEPVEGAVWRVEREGRVDFLGKYVRQFKEDGKYFNEDHSKLIWNWRD